MLNCYFSRVRAIRTLGTIMNDAQKEEEILAKTRDVSLDVVATYHMIKSYKSGEKSWTCQCFACNYVRKTPELVKAIARAIVRGVKQKCN
jgi:hypothetical protein